MGESSQDSKEADKDEETEVEKQPEAEKEVAPKVDKEEEHDDLEEDLRSLLRKPSNAADELLDCISEDESIAEVDTLSDEASEEGDADSVEGNGAEVSQVMLFVFNMESDDSRESVEANLQVPHFLLCVVLVVLAISPPTQSPG